MIRRSLGARLGVASLLAALALAPSGLAKPPDLPNSPPIAFAPPLPWLPPMSATDGGQWMDLESSPVPAPIAEDVRKIVEETNTGRLLFGIGVNSDSGLTGSIVLNERNFDVCVPMTFEEFLSGNSFRSAGSAIRLSVRRKLATSLLFIAHPVLSLLPVDQLLDRPEDHPAPVTEETSRDLSGAPWMEPPLTSALVCAAQYYVPIPAEPVADVSEPVKAMPAEVVKPATQCPYRCAQQALADRHVHLFAEANLGPSVMDNLRKLQEAARGIQEARSLAAEGQTAEAIQRLEAVAKLCPGSSVEEKVAEALSDVFASLYGMPEASAAEEEEQEYKAEDYERAREWMDDVGTWWLELFGKWNGYDLIDAGLPEGLGARLDNCPPCSLCPGCPPGTCPIQAWLDSKVTADYAGAPLQIVLDNLRACRPIPIEYDVAALQAADVSLIQPITIKLEEVMVREALPMVLGQAKLAHALRDGIVIVTTQEVAACLPGACPMPVAPVAAVVPSAPEQEAPVCESACPKCEEMHRKLAVQTQVRGLMKACYQALADGRFEKAAALAREAHALDAKAVEADPLVYKLHVLVGKPIAFHCGKGNCAEEKAICKPKKAANGAGEEAEPKPVKPANKEREIKRKLAKPVSAHFTGCPFQDAIARLREANGINIVLDYRALQEEGIDLKRPVFLKLEHASLKAALHLMLQQVDLGYVIKDEVVFVTTPSACRGRLKVEIYKVRDLIDDEEVGKLLCWNEPGHEPLIRMLTASVLPHSWTAAGGPGTIEYYAPAKSLVVNQTIEGHEQFRAMLGSLRRHVKEAKSKHEGQDQASSEEDKQGAMLCPALPPVDPRIVAALDEVLREADVLDRPCGAAPVAAGEEDCEAPVAVEKKGRLRCRLKCDGCCCGLCDFVRELFGTALEDLPGGSFEIDLGKKGLRVYAKVPVAGLFVHVLYDQETCRGWMSVDGAEEECEVKEGK